MNTQKIIYGFRQFKLTVLIIGVLLAINGCSNSNPKGNFTPIFANLEQNYQAQIAENLTEQLIELYNPADTTFIFTLDAGDYFGKSLITKLRLKGYAVQEHDNDDVYHINFSQYVTTEEKERTKLEYERATKNPYRHKLSYAVIPVKQNSNTLDELYQVTLYINTTRRISNLWQINFDSLTNTTNLTANGLWTLQN